MDLHTVFDEYRTHRKLHMRFDEFLPFVLHYPALLVVHTDGRIDQHEWQFLDEMAHVISRQFLKTYPDPAEISDLKKMYVAEFTYLLQHFDTWERKFIKALRQYVRENPPAQPTVLRAMYASAESSGGISDKERVMIDHLKNELGIQ